MLIGGFLCLVTISMFAWTHFVHLPGTERRRDDLLVTLKLKQAEAKKADEIEAEIRLYRMRVDAVAKIRKSRVVWARQLDWIVDIVPADIWLTSIETTPAKQVRRGKESIDLGPTVKLTAVCAGTDEKRIASFLKKIQAHEMFRSKYDLVEWSTITETDTPEGTALSFSAELYMKPVANQTDPGKGKG